METLSIILIAVMGASVAYPIIFNRWGTVSLVLGNLAVYFSLMAVSLAGKDVLLYHVVMDLIFFPSDLSGPGAYTALTSAFLHLAPMHIFMNLVFLFLLGFPLEIRQESRKMAALYLPSAFGGSVLYALLSADNTPALGASGAIAGFLGALVALYPKDEIPMFLGPIFLRKVPVYVVAAVFLLMESAYAVGTADSVAHTAHIGGLMAGMAVGALFSKIAWKDEKAGKIDTEGLSGLAHSEESREILNRIGAEDNPEIREAWMQEFLDSVACPKCNGVLELKGKKIVCTRCGWERRIE